MIDGSLSKRSKGVLRRLERTIEDSSREHCVAESGNWLLLLWFMPSSFSEKKVANTLRDNPYPRSFSCSRFCSCRSSFCPIMFSHVLLPSFLFLTLERVRRVEELIIRTVEQRQVRERERRMENIFLVLPTV